MADEDTKPPLAREQQPADMVPVDGTVNATPDPIKGAATGTTVDETSGSQPGEQPNAALTTIDDLTVEQAGKERTDPANPDTPAVSDQTPAETPSKVLEQALQPGPVVQSSEQADKTQETLVVAPGTGQGLEIARDNAMGGPSALPNPANPVNDIGAGAADATAYDVAVSAPAKPKPTSDGLNAGAVDATGYVAPVRVSAAGVPATDPTVAAANVGDVGTQSSGSPGAFLPKTGPGTSDKPNTDVPSTGADATQAGVNSRLNGNAQAANPGTADPSPDFKAAVDGRVAAMTGAPLPPSGGDRTMTTPTPAGDVEAAHRVATFHTQDEPQAPAEVAPAPAAPAEASARTPSDGRADPAAVATAIDAANQSSNPAPAHPDTARPVGEPIGAESPAAEAVTEKVTSVPARDGTSGDPAVSGGAPDQTAAPAAPAAPEQPESPAEPDDEEDIPMATNEQKIAAAEKLHEDGVLPEAVLTDVRATLAGPQSEAEVQSSPDDEGEVHTIKHQVVSETTYKVRAKDTAAAIQAVKDGKGASTSVTADDAWEGH